MSAKKSPAKKAARKTAKPKAPKTVLVLRTCKADGTSYGGFQWPLEIGAEVSAPDWSPSPECGNGLNGWLWGCGNWKLKAEGNDILWYVLEVAASAIVDLDGKVKFPTCRIKAIEKRWDLAMAYIRGHADLAAESLATGTYGHASATGYYGHASATGDHGHASATGDHGHASATGNYGHASATGDHGWAISNRGKAKAGKDGIITIRWKDGERFRVVTGYVGEEGIEADVWYHVENGKLMPCEPE